MTTRLSCWPVSMDDDAETLTTVATLLAIAVPLLLLLVAVTTWLVVGRALRPVERIREKVDGITAERLHQRVPVPETADEIAALATHHERHARPTRCRRHRAATLRVGRLARAALPRSRPSVSTPSSRRHTRT